VTCRMPPPTPTPPPPPRRVLDSTPLYDAVATMDTVTLVRSAIRGLLKAADGELAGELRAVLRRDDELYGRGQTGL
jgi:hypothetical protein